MINIDEAKKKVFVNYLGATSTFLTCYDQKMKRSDDLALLPTCRPTPFLLYSINSYLPSCRLPSSS